MLSLSCFARRSFRCRHENRHKVKAQRSLLLCILRTPTRTHAKPLRIKLNSKQRHTQTHTHEYIVSENLIILTTCYPNIKHISDMYINFHGIVNTCTEENTKIPKQWRRRRTTLSMGVFSLVESVFVFLGRARREYSKKSGNTFGNSLCQRIGYDEKAHTQSQRWTISIISIFSVCFSFWRVSCWNFFFSPCFGHTWLRIGAEMLLVFFHPNHFSIDFIQLVNGMYLAGSKLIQTTARHVRIITRSFEFIFRCSEIGKWIRDANCFSFKFLR